MDKKLEDHLEEQAETIIGPSATIHGELSGEESIKIEGHVNGKITTSQMVSVAQNAIIMAEVEAKNAIIAGEIQGHLQISGRLVLLSTAKVSADITCPTLKVEKGAFYTGKCAMDGNTLATTGQKDRGI